MNGNSRLVFGQSGCFCIGSQLCHAAINGFFAVLKNPRDISATAGPEFADSLLSAC